MAAARPVVSRKVVRWLGVKPVRPAVRALAAHTGLTRVFWLISVPIGRTSASLYQNVSLLPPQQTLPMGRGSASSGRIWEFRLHRPEFRFRRIVLKKSVVLIQSGLGNWSTADDGGTSERAGRPVLRVFTRTTRAGEAPAAID